MKQWLAGLSPRERIMVQLTAALLLLFLLYLLVIEPLQLGYARYQKRVTQAQQTLLWMQDAVQEVKQLSASKTENLTGERQFLPGLIDRSVRKAGLASMMKRIQPEGEGGVRIWFEQVGFDNFVRWLAELEQQHGLQVNEINIEQAGVSGRVNVRLYLN